MKDTSYIPKEFGKRIRQIRLDRFWTLEQMSVAVGICPASLHKYENGKGTPTPLTAAKIRRVFPVLFEDVA
jgi:transcriptional regulator with XRE-family HTH domain